ncbi:MAG: cation-transporting P-type ATPase [Phycisphaeraceae bacterium]|nr:cation-transporting P-type ATPase [Phycisphaeraceae bacterium]
MLEPDQLSETPWHARSAEECLQAVESRPEGLSSEDARARRESFGPNQLRPPKRRSAWARLLAQFHNVLIYVLLASGLVTAALQHWTDTAVIFGVVVINALIGFVQEGKAERAMEAIRGMLSPQASVLRDGRRMTLPAADLVPGDVVHLQSGDRVPADLRLKHSRELRIDESALTGESQPVEKTIDPVAEQAVVGDRLCMAFSGTLVTYGQGTGVVVATGDQTELGRISGMLAHVQPLNTRLLQKIAQFGRWLTLAIVLVAAATFTYGVLVQHNSTTEMFMAVVGLAVAAIPEGLPAIITITLAIGVQRMARRNAIIRRLPAVETLGSVTVICSDKTGTLTRNEMTAKTITTAEQTLEISGVGYEPSGAIQLLNACVDVEQHPVLLDLLRAGALCNEANLVCNNEEWEIHGDPTEGALVTLAAKGRLVIDPLRESYPLIDTVPFESEHRYMATLHHTPGGERLIYLKGAPERVLEMCDREATMDGDRPIERDHWLAAMEQTALRGQRLLALARSGADDGQTHLDHEHVQQNMVLLGLVGIIDPPRVEAVTAVRQCHQAGIRVKMITGDHVATAKAVGQSMNIGDGVHAMTGQQLEAMTVDQLRQVVDEVDVFARVSPEHKLHLVEALQARDQIVAMTGDGVNDAPALKRADVGVAMGVKGTEAAKEAAEMVLTDDNFATITRAVEEGRTVYDNIKKAILFILPTNAAEAGTIVAAIAMGRMLPVTPLQILWVNMVTAVTLGLSLAFEPAEADVMKRPPRAPNEPILTGLVIWRVFFVGALLVAGVFGLFVLERVNGASLETARTVAVNMLVMFEVVYLISTRYLRRSSLNLEGIFGSGYVLGAIGAVLIAQILMTYTTPMQTLFETRPLGIASWWPILLAALGLFLIVEMEKWIWRRLTRSSQPG